MRQTEAEYTELEVEAFAFGLSVSDYARRLIAFARRELSRARPGRPVEDLMGFSDPVE